MTLPASGPLAFSDIQGEFAGSNPISLAEYYGRTPGIPASGQIAVSNFYGMSAGSTFQVQAASIAPLNTTDFSNNIGYDVRFGLGTLLSSNLPSPLVIAVAEQAIVTAQVAPNNKLVELWIGGFVADPGVGKLSYVTLNGVTKLGASASLYQYFSGPGRARWTWTAQFSDWGFAIGNPYSGIVVLT